MRFAAAIKSWFTPEEVMLEINKIYNDDCLIKMKEIDNNSIDAIITDLPYG